MNTVELIALTPDLIEAIAEDAAAALEPVASNAGAVSKTVFKVAAAHRTLYAATQAEAPWLGYLARDPASDAIVGCCAFAKPLNAGEVEIAYFTFPPYEGKGFATAMGRALVDIALDEAGVERVVALTLPTPGASTAILANLGFARDGESTDPDSGVVWRWALERG